MYTRTEKRIGEKKQNSRAASEKNIRKCLDL